MRKTKEYKIRHKDTGLFYKPVSYSIEDNWHKEGKYWKSLGSIRTSFNNISNPYNYKLGGKHFIVDSENWEIVEYEIERIIVELGIKSMVQDKHRNNIIAFLNKNYEYGPAVNFTNFGLSINIKTYRYMIYLSESIDNSNHTWRHRGYSWSYSDNQKILSTFKNYGIKRSNYRYRSSCILFKNLDEAMAIKIAHAENILFLLDLKDIKVL